MAYVYSTDMFEHIDVRLAEATSTLKKLDGDPIEQQYHKGRVQALSDFKSYLESRVIPVDSRVLKILNDSPLVFDIYLWLF